MLEIVPYNPDLKNDFYEINAEWIRNMFVLEELDEKVLKNPEEMIINQGGYIFFAKDSELGVIGTCALRKTGDGEYELTKMGVLEKARGLKAGEKLLQYVIQFVKENGLPYCYLLTNKNCEAAIHLYEKNGFVHSEEVKEKFGGLYERCNVAMKLEN